MRIRLEAGDYSLQPSNLLDTYNGTESLSLIHDEEVDVDERFGHSLLIFEKERLVVARDVVFDHAKELAPFALIDDPVTAKLDSLSLAQAGLAKIGGKSNITEDERNQLVRWLVGVRILKPDNKLKEMADIRIQELSPEEIRFAESKFNEVRAAFPSDTPKTYLSLRNALEYFKNAQPGYYVAKSDRKISCGDYFAGIKHLLWEICSDASFLHRWLRNAFANLGLDPGPVAALEFSNSAVASTMFGEPGQKMSIWEFEQRKNSHDRMVNEPIESFFNVASTRLFEVGELPKCWFFKPYPTAPIRQDDTSRLLEWVSELYAEKHKYPKDFIDQVLRILNEWDMTRPGEPRRYGQFDRFREMEFETADQVRRVGELLHGALRDLNFTVITPPAKVIPEPAPTGENYHLRRFIRSVYESLAKLQDALELDAIRHRRGEAVSHSQRAAYAVQQELRTFCNTVLGPLSQQAIVECENGPLNYRSPGYPGDYIELIKIRFPDVVEHWLSKLIANEEYVSIYEPVSGYSGSPAYEICFALGRLINGRSRMTWYDEGLKPRQPTLAETWAVTLSLANDYSGTHPWASRQYDLRKIEENKRKLTPDYAKWMSVPGAEDYGRQIEAAKLQLMVWDEAWQDFENKLGQVCPEVIPLLPDKQDPKAFADGEQCRLKVKAVKELLLKSYPKTPGIPPVVPSMEAISSLPNWPTSIELSRSEEVILRDFKRWLVLKYMEAPVPDTDRVPPNQSDRAVLEMQNEGVVFLPYQVVADWLKDKDAEPVAILESAKNRSWTYDLRLVIPPGGQAHVMFSRLNLPQGDHRIIGIRKRVLSRDEPLPETPTEILPNPVTAPAGESTGEGEKPHRRQKKSTRKGEAREKIIGVLNRHHQYDGERCGEWTPCIMNAIARLAEVSPGSAHYFFKKELGGHARYIKLCNTKSETLNFDLKRLNGDIPPSHTLQMIEDVAADHSDESNELSDTD